MNRSIGDYSVRTFNAWREGGPRLARASSAMKLALASVGEGPEDGAGVLVHDLTKVHGDGKQEDQEKKVDPKE